MIAAIHAFRDLYDGRYTHGANSQSLRYTAVIQVPMTCKPYIDAP